MEKPHVVVDSVYTGLLPARGHAVTVVRPRVPPRRSRSRGTLGHRGADHVPDEPATLRSFNVGRAPDARRSGSTARRTRGVVV